jgi:hypothetical protein
MTDLIAPAAKTKKARPSVRERAGEKLCPNCGKPSPERISSRGPAPIYCRKTEDRDCKREMNNRNLADGLALVPYVKAWRVDRGSGEIAQTSFARLCKIADDLNAADIRDDRPRADYYAATLIASQAATVDELRYGRRKIAENRERAALEAGDVAQPAPIVEAPEPAPQLDLAEILRLIAEGHNDPRALAAAALAAR